MQVIVLPCDENKSAPNHILENLVKYKEIYELGENDELWLVIDVDRWGDKKLGQVAAESNQRSFNLAVSNPCFEVWLYLHFDEIKETKLSCNELEKKLKDSLGSYDKSKLDKRRYEQNNKCDS
ncbi:MAG: RloB domain-containing protein [Blastocatellia bacterium]|nr:RloB domain-containing protein [Blastocatellia bacterium]